MKPRRSFKWSTVTGRDFARSIRWARSKGGLLAQAKVKGPERRRKD
ncbi:MAG: hypothetical protein RJA36_3833 [Pseudomonadota bacterium]|jgi:hypothetical protein